MLSFESDSDTPMLSLVKRHSVTAQATLMIRKSLESREWRDALPGERELALRLGVSRPTVRAALGVLEREGLLQNAQGKRRVPVHAGSSPRRRQAGPKVVGFIAPEVAHSGSAAQLLRVGELRSYLHELGYRLEVHSESRLFSDHPDQALEHLVQMNPSRCWVLNAANLPLQRWFAHRRLPAILVGTCYPGVKLPAMSLHHRAVCRHAVGAFTRLGHRRIAFVIRDSRLAGDIESEQGFLAAIEEAKLDASLCPIIRHDSSVRDIRSVLNAVLEADPIPTALLVAVPAHTITVASHVMAEGYRIPQDISIVCRDGDYYLDHFALRLARYSFHSETHVRRLCRMVGRMVESNDVPARQFRLIPNLDKGQTLARPPADVD
jgi:DNA-binding LacI/PurR family transcriptional regulator